MFTGIVEAVGTIVHIEKQGSNKTFWIESPISPKLTVDQSVSHSGVCLTVEAIEENRHRVTAIEETLVKSNFNQLNAGDQLNLERCMLLNERIDGHIVQGHVDTTADCIGKKDLNGSWEYRFLFDEQYGPLIIEKGSIAVNGISLTLFDVGLNSFSVAIIPYTYHHTTMKHLTVGITVNIEFDIIGKYIRRTLELQKP